MKYSVLGLNKSYQRGKNDMKNISKIFLIVFISFGIIGGCGGGGGGGGDGNGGGGFRKEVNCKKAFDNNSTFCSTFNPRSLL